MIDGLLARSRNLFSRNPVSFLTTAGTAPKIRFSIHLPTRFHVCDRVAFTEILSISLSFAHTRPVSPKQGLDESIVDTGIRASTLEIPASKLTPPTPGRKKSKEAIWILCNSPWNLVRRFFLGSTRPLPLDGVLKDACIVALLGRLDGHPQLRHHGIRVLAPEILIGPQLLVSARGVEELVHYLLVSDVGDGWRTSRARRGGETWELQVQRGIRELRSTVARSDVGRCGREIATAVRGGLIPGDYEYKRCTRNGNRSLGLDSRGIASKEPGSGIVTATDPSPCP